MHISKGEIDLEARWDVPNSDAATCVVFCHPHPQHGGTMRAPLMHKVTKAMVAGGLAVLRFNFRGVGESAGEWSGGVGEIDDVDAAMREAADLYGMSVGLAGWSFGAATALRWQAGAGSSASYVGIAPPVTMDLVPVLPEPGDLAGGRRLFIVGSRDQFVTTAELADYAASIDADLEVLEGSDHFFYFREQKVGELLAGFFAS
ncbi:MAG: hypothetical protein V3R84_03460 [Acidimicrobiia bacterium]